MTQTVTVQKPQARAAPEAFGAGQTVREVPVVIRARLVIAVVGAATAAVAIAAATGSAQSGGPQQLEAKLLRTYDAFDANQGVAVDSSHFFAVDNRQITQHKRSTGEPLLQFSAVSGGPIIHMDSGAIYRGKLYAAHSNYD